MNAPTISIWYDTRTEAFEVVLWKEGTPTVLQGNIRTHQKAHAAANIWRARMARNAGGDAHADR